MYGAVPFGIAVKDAFRALLHAATVSNVAVKSAWSTKTEDEKLHPLLSVTTTEYVPLIKESAIAVVWPSDHK